MLRLNRKGFTLVELMIVVAIIALLVAIAIPNLLRARINANDSAAQGVLRTLQTAQESFRAAQVPPAYATLIGAPAVATTLQFTTVAAGPPYVTGFIAATAVAGYEWQRNGYAYGCASAAATPNQYECRATPEVQGTTGIRAFCVDQQGVLMVTNPGPLAAAAAAGVCPGAPL